MFNDTEVKIYSDNIFSSYLNVINADVQPYSKSITFEDGFQIDITKRMFCDRDASVTQESYLEIENKKFKVMEIKEWDDYLEVYLYELVRQV
ncbi:hypothetical protein JCM14036_16760 [Desulfotomaculum defluvii]